MQFAITAHSAIQMIKLKRRVVRKLLDGDLPEELRYVNLEHLNS
jgi:hypothetical protein